MSATAKSSPEKYKVLTGIRFPKSKTIRDRIREGEATSADVKDWVRIKASDRSVSIPSDVAKEFLRRKAIKEA